jgi:serine/threonine-protein kinase
VSEEFVEPTTLRDPAIGATVNGYRIVGRLGQGGMGLVYEGLEPDIGKRDRKSVV